MTIMEKKVCSRCLIEKSFNDFQKNKSSRDGYRSECSECSRIAKNKISKDIINEYHKNYREKNRIKLNEKQRLYYELNKEKELLRNKINRDKNKDSKPEITKNKEKISWQKINKSLLNKKRRQKYKGNILFRLSLNVRNRMNSFLKTKKIKKNGKTFDIVGCEPEFLREYLEKQFIDGMSWENRNTWHIDHIKPLSSAKNEEELYELCHYTNLQPLWVKDNLKKGGNIK